MVLIEGAEIPSGTMYRDRKWEMEGQTLQYYYGCTKHKASLYGATGFPAAPFWEAMYSRRASAPCAHLDAHNEIQHGTGAAVEDKGGQGLFPDAQGDGHQRPYG